MVEQHRYDGHDIALELVEVAPGRVRWVWCIDGLHRAKARHTAATPGVARSEALLYAQVMIGRLASHERAPTRP